MHGAQWHWVWPNSRCGFALYPWMIWSLLLNVWALAVEPPAAHSGSLSKTDDWCIGYSVHLHSPSPSPWMEGGKEGLECLPSNPELAKMHFFA